MVICAELRFVTTCGLSVSRQADVAGRAFKKTLRPERRRELVRDLEGRYGVSERRSCRVLLFFRSSHRYEATRDDQVALRMRI